MLKEEIVRPLFLNVRAGSCLLPILGVRSDALNSDTVCLWPYFGREKGGSNAGWPPPMRKREG